jgi:UDP-N-acetylmuramoyl-tripeptide--D-alanyl-D-alanine ligase
MIQVLEMNFELLLAQAAVLGMVGMVFAVRWVRWLAIAQQKEYRWDRLVAHIKTPEGTQDVLKLRLLPKDFKRSALKRPKITPRVVVLGLLSGLVALFLIAWLLQFGFGAVMVGLTGWWLLMPLVVMIATLPTTLVSMVLTQHKLQQAKQLIQEGNPIIVGITGSYGKSTTKHLVAAVLGSKYSVFTTPLSHNTRYSVANAIVSGYRRQQVAVLEYAAYTKGEIKELASWFPPQLAVITGLAPQHLELFGSIENIIKAKSELIKALTKPSLVFYNGLDVQTLKICEAGDASHQHEWVNATPIAGADFPKHIGLTDLGCLTFVWRGHTVVTRLVGKHYLAAVQTAIAVGLELGVDERAIVAALTQFQPNETFIDSFKLKSGSLVIDDGRTANPTGFKAALSLLTELAKKRTTILVTAGIVDLGEDSAKVHGQLAQECAGQVDRIYYLGQPGLKEFQKVLGSRVITDQAALKTALTQLTSSEIILLEGKLPLWLLEQMNTLREDAP